MKKFRDPKTANVFDDIDVARRVFCSQTEFCENCPIGCVELARNKPAETARLMGYEVIDDLSTEIDDTPTKEDNMDKQDKPLSEWTLGEVKAECAAHKNGCCDCKLCNSSFCASPNGNPAEWVLTPRLTEPELAICRATGAKWVSRDDFVRSIELWREKPRKTDSGIYLGEQSGSKIAVVKLSLFPSVELGDCIEVEGT